jgi:hypothetical protein
MRHPSTVDNTPLPDKGHRKAAQKDNTSAIESNRHSVHVSKSISWIHPVSAAIYVFAYGQRWYKSIRSHAFCRESLERSIMPLCTRAKCIVNNTKRRRKNEKKNTVLGCYERNDYIAIARASRSRDSRDLNNVPEANGRNNYQRVRKYVKCIN